MQRMPMQPPEAVVVLDPATVAQALHRARVLRAQRFTRAFSAPWNGIRSRIDAARRAAGAPLAAGA